MKIERKNFLKELILKKVGEYGSATKIAETFHLSLNFVYALCNNNKVKVRKKFGRSEYFVEDFLNLIEFGENDKILSNPLSKDELDLNNFYNWDFKNPIEEFMMRILLENLGEFTSTKELVELFKVSKTIWYELMESGKIIYFNISNRKVILTRSLIFLLREALMEKE